MERVYSTADKVQRLLGYEKAEEIERLENSYGGMIDKRFKPEITYEDKEMVLAVTYYIDTNTLWLALECLEENKEYLEMSTNLTEENIERLVKEFVNNIKRK